MTMKDELGRRPSMVDQLNEAIRENPLAAGLIGAGVAWMLLGSKGLGAVAGAAKTAADAAATTAGAAAVGMGSAAAAAGSRASTAIKDAANAAKEAATGAVRSAPSLVPEIPDPPNATGAMSDAGAALRERARAAAASGREYGAAMQSRLSESLERQPLLLGAIGLAIGAGIAASFAATAVEREWMGESAAAARAKAEALGETMRDHTRRVMAEVREEAERQGLTPEAIKDTAASVAGKAKSVAKTAQTSAARTFNEKTKA